MTTAHSNSPRDTLSRIETMTMMAGMDLPAKAIREQVASAIDLIAHQERMRDGTRKVTHITEISGMEGEVITMTDIFIFEQTGIENGQIVGRLRPTGCDQSLWTKLKLRYIASVILASVNGGVISMMSLTGC
jgi:pilus assembly protein CpaF